MDLDRTQIDDKIVRMLKKADRYKLFKFDIKINPIKVTVKNLEKILKEMPDSQFSNIRVNFYYVLKKDDKILNTVLQILINMNRQDLFKALIVNDEHINQQSEPLEYLSYIKYPHRYDMS